MTQPTNRRLATESYVATGLATKVNSSTYTTGLAAKQDAVTLSADTASHVSDGSALADALRAASVAAASGGIVVGNAVAADSSTPIIPIGTGDDWDTSIREIGNVVWDGALYRMLYTGHTGANAGNNVYVGLATSTDGVTWTKQGRLTGITRSSEDPYLLRVGNTWHLFVEDKEEVPFRAIRKYHSTDFVTWADDGQVLTQGTGWESRDVSSPAVWVDADGWHMLYEGRGSAGLGSTGYATSPDGLLWTRHPANPVISPTNVPWALQAVCDDTFVLAGRRYLTLHTHDGVVWSTALVAAPLTDPTTWLDLFGLPLQVGGLAPGAGPGSVMAVLTPADQLLLTLGETSAGGILRGSFVPANAASAVRFTPTGAVTATTVQKAIEQAAGASADPDALAIGESVFGRRLATAVTALTSGSMRLTFFTARKTETVTSVRTSTGGTAAAGTTLARLGVYREEADGSITLVGSTANDTALFGSASTSYTRALTTPFQKVAGTRYAVGVLVVATTPPSVQALGLVAAVEASLAPRLNGTVTSLSDLPASVASGALATGSIQYYFALLP